MALCIFPQQFSRGCRIAFFGRRVKDSQFAIAKSNRTQICIDLIGLPENTEMWDVNMKG